MTVLRQAIGSSSQDSFLDSIHPSKFQNEEIRKCIQDLHLNYTAPHQVANASKRRRISEETTDSLAILTQGIYETLQITPPPDDDVVMFEQIYM
jgi:serine/threonine-protein kinase ATR